VHYGKTATFMPKPVMGDNGSGMHTHQSLWKAERPLFAGNLYADLSETALFYIGGIIHHAKTINAFTNPTTNSSKRLIPGFEAPVVARLLVAQPLGRLPHPVCGQPQRQALEVRYPDPAANPLSRLCPRLPAQRRRLQHGPDRSLYGIEVGGGVRLRAHPAPDRIPDVLLGLEDMGAGARSAVIYAIVKLTPTMTNRERSIGDCTAIIRQFAQSSPSTQASISSRRGKRPPCAISERRAARQTGCRR
jgi:glutamine synthetase-like protein